MSTPLLVNGDRADGECDGGNGDGDGEYDRGHALPLFPACAQPAQVDRRRPTESYMLTWQISFVANAKMSRA